MNHCLLLTLPHHSSYFPLLSSSPKTNKHHFSLHRCCYYDNNNNNNNNKWDPNAESFKTQKKKNFNFNFKNNPRNANRYYYDDVVEEVDDDEDDDGVGLLEEYIDSIWILKVFGTYGWALPFIILSILLSSGPKAFLMALALPLGQSTFSFAFQKLWGSKDTKSKHKTKARKRSRTGRSRTVKGKKTAEEKMGYQTWVPRRDFTADKPNDAGGATSFGGWDELDRESDFGRGSSITSDPTIIGGSRKTSPGEGKFSTIGRKSDTSLLLRLLVSAFPFLSSWTKML